MASKGFPISRPLRIILVLLEPPLPFGNPAARWYYVLLKGLQERGHRVTAFAACSDAGQIAEAEALFPKSRYDLRCFGLSRRRGVSAKLATLREPYSYLFSDEMKSALRAELARGCDVLHLEQLWSGWLAEMHAGPSVVNVHYLFSIDLNGGVTGLRNQFRQVLTTRAERKLLRSVPFVSTLTPRLTDAVGLIAPNVNVRTMPMGLDPALYAFEAEDHVHEQPTLGLIGSFNWPPGESAGRRLLQSLWPRVQREVPNARLQVVGRKAKERLTKYVGDASSVELYEDVPDVLPYFRSTDALLYAPHQGSGMKVKVMEAFAWGTPVVTTVDGAEGLDIENGVHALVGRTDDELVAHAVRLLRDPQQRRAQRMAGRRLIEQKYSPAALIPQVEQMYEQMIGAPARTGAETQAQEYQLIA